MAYLLRYNSENIGASDNDITISDGRWTGGGSDNWYVQLDLIWNGAQTSELPLIGRDSSNSRYGYVLNGRVGWDSVGIESDVVLTAGQRYLIRFESEGEQKRILVDDGSGFVDVASTASFTTNIQFSVILARGAAKGRDFDLYGFKFFGGDYDDEWSGETAPSAGTTWESLSGARNVTFGAQTESDHWVFYEDGAGDTTVNPTTATSTSTAANPAVSAGASVTATTANSTSEGIAPAVSAGTSVTPTAAESTSTAIDPAVLSGASASPASAHSTGTALEPQVTTDQSVLVEPTATESVSVSPDPVISAGAAVQPTTAVSVSAANDPVIGIAVVVRPTAAESASAPIAPTVTSGASALPAAVYSDSAANDPVVSTAANVFPITARSTATALDPLVSGGLDRYVVKKTINGVYYRNVSLRGEYPRGAEIQGIFPRRLTLRS